MFSNLTTPACCCSLQQRKYAWAVYALLIAGFLVAVFYTIYSACILPSAQCVHLRSRFAAGVQARKAPPTVVTNVKQQYKQPIYSLCTNGFNVTVRTLIVAS